MRVGAIITVPGGVQPARGATSLEETVKQPYSSAALGGVPLACCDVLGMSVIERVQANLRGFGVEQQTVLNEECASQSVFPPKGPVSGQFFSAWEDSVAQHVNSGAEVLLLMRVGGYLDLDLSDLLDFHNQTSGVLTQVYDNKSAFEVALVNTRHLRGERGSFRGRLGSLIPYHHRYHFMGYANRLREPKDLRRLAYDALSRRNSIIPVGREVAPGVWMGEGAKVDSTTRLVGPVFIGSRANVKGACVINGASSIERDCEVDFGSRITNSSVLQETYLGIGLDILNSIVARDKLYDLDRSVEVEISDPSLIGKQRSFRTFTKVMGSKRFFNWPGRQPNAVESHL